VSAREDLVAALLLVSLLVLAADWWLFGIAR
jgi:hypothetical protein